MMRHSAFSIRRGCGGRILGDVLVVLQEEDCDDDAYARYVGWGCTVVGDYAGGQIPGGAAEFSGGDGGDGGGGVDAEDGAR